MKEALPLLAALLHKGRFSKKAKDSVLMELNILESRWPSSHKQFPSPNPTACPASWVCPAVVQLPLLPRSPSFSRSPFFKALTFPSSFPVSPLPSPLNF